MRREKEVADYLRSDAALVALAPGGIYHDALLPPTGLTNAQKMTKVWAGGVFNTTIVVREGAPVPTGDLQSVRSKRTSMSQRISVVIHSQDAEAIENVRTHVYALMMGKRLTAAFRATWIETGRVMQAPELPPGIMRQNEDYRYVAIRRAVEV